MKNCLVIWTGLGSLEEVMEDGDHAGRVLVLVIKTDVTPVWKSFVTGSGPCHLLSIDHDVNRHIP